MQRTALHYKSVNDTDIEFTVVEKCHGGAKRQGPNSVQARHKAIVVPSTTKQQDMTGQKPLVSDGDVDRTDSLSYLGMHIDRMPNVQNADRINKTRVTALKATAAKQRNKQTNKIEQCRSVPVE